ncbi:MAG: hypothetical protein V4671_23465 [Armatimonadota bacterium]
MKLLKFSLQVTKPSLYSALRTVSLTAAALLLCLMVLGQPARAQGFYSDATIDYAINNRVSVYGSSTVSLVSGGSITEDLAASDTSTVNISGGSVTGGLVAYNSSTINISSGSLAGDLFAYGTSTINISGGSLGGELYINGGKVILSGGSLGTDLYINNFGTLDVYGTGLSLTGPFGPQYSLPYYTLSGTLADGTAINKPVYLNGVPLSQVVLHNTDPLVVLKSQVQALADAGALSKGNTNALLTKLSAAQSAAAAGDTAAERDALTGFINQVKSFIRTGKLTQAQGTALTTAAQAILGSLG